MSIQQNARGRDKRARALVWANLAVILTAGAFGVAGQLHLSLGLQLGGSIAVLCTLLIVWYLQYQPEVSWLSEMSTPQRLATALSIALVGVGLWMLLSTADGPTPSLAVPQRIASPLAIDTDGTYTIGAAGSADGVPGTVVLRLEPDSSLDPSFGENGIAFHRIGVGATRVDSILVEADGSVVLAGADVPPDEPRMAFLGRLDPSGVAEPNFSSESEVNPRSEALVQRQSPHRLLLALTAHLDPADTARPHGVYVSNSSFAVLAIDNSGELDRTYGQSGTAYGPIGCGRLVDIPCRPVRALLLRPNGETVLAAAAVTALKPDGTLRPLSAGVVFHAPREGWTSLAADNEGRVLAGGAKAGGPHAEQEFLLARFEPNKSFDPVKAFDRTFGNRGLAEVDLPADQSELGGIAPLRDGKILVVGRSATYGRDGIAVARLGETGEVDRSFGPGGVVMLHPLHFPKPLTRTASTAIAVDPEGRILAAEILAPPAQATTGGALAVARLTSSGKLDPSFGRNGIASWNLDFRSIRVVRAGDRALGLPPQSRAVRAEGFKFPRLGILCLSTGAPAFTCNKVDGGSTLEIRLTGSGKPTVAHRPGSRPLTFSAAWRRAPSMGSGEEAWIRTRVGALYCTGLSDELVCTNRSRHGFLIGPSRIRTW